MASAFIMLVRSVSSSFQTFSRTVARARVLLSNRYANDAPWDRASRARAPLPANASRTMAPDTALLLSFHLPWVSMLNMDSRTASLVGRVIIDGGREIGRPLCLPAIMRITHSWSYFPACVAYYRVCC